MTRLFCRVFHITVIGWALQAFYVNATPIDSCEKSKRSLNKPIELSTIQKQSLNLSLTREEWQEDLATLDTYIRCFHVHPFLKTDEAGYLRLLNEAKIYLSESNTLDAHHINGYFERLVAYTADGHSYVAKKAIRFGSLPYRLDWFANELYVVGIDKDDKELLGAKVIGINGKKLEDVNTQLEPFLPVVNSLVFWHLIYA